MAGCQAFVDEGHLTGIEVLNNMNVFMLLSSMWNRMNVALNVPWVLLKCPTKCNKPLMATKFKGVTE